MFPFPQGGGGGSFAFPSQVPDGGNGGMTANQVPQPMAQQSMPPMQGGGGSPQVGALGAGMQQPMPQSLGMPMPSAQGGGGGSIDPQQLALLRLLLEQQQRQPNGNLQALLGL